MDEVMEQIKIPLQTGRKEWRSLKLKSLDFHLPAELEADAPPESRGLARDQVRLMVTFRSNHRVIHTQFRKISEFFRPGDVLVINTSGTMNAAINVQRLDGTPLELHLSTHLPGDLWVVELRTPHEAGNKPFFTAQSNEALNMPGMGRARLLLPYRQDQRRAQIADMPVRLWIAALEIPVPLEAYLEQYGFPIRYKYVRKGWPLSYYQTVYATQKGSAEMPSAGRAFTPELVTRLVAQGVHVVPLVLHTGVASLEEHEPPYEEYYRVPAETARTVNAAHAHGKRVIAVGTTVVRALETVTGEDRYTNPGEGWTNLIVSPERGLHAVDGLLTGLHEPRSSHLAMLATLVGYERLSKAYNEALENGYLWHEFGDLHLILP
jgi:S-adenosylmethionine:tRNA ribosyltransferase-isomerase